MADTESDRRAEYVAVVEAALRDNGPEIGAEMWYSHRDAAEVAVRALAAAGLLRRDYDRDEEGVRVANEDTQPNPLGPILRAARESVELHDGTKREYPGYIWIEWDDLVRFVQAAGPPTPDSGAMSFAWWHYQQGHRYEVSGDEGRRSVTCDCGEEYTP